MPDFRLPHFYHLSVAVLLGMFVMSRLYDLARLPGGPLENTVAMVTALPAATAAYYFWQQYQERRELSVREGMFILTAVKFCTSMITYFLG
ncbi:hypothetical protein [Neolewinella antarctica]|uniref:Uncharacterized protein n=1 Tax=Neolewinella antarctica TaxID=442734 RepID=A0ABX0X9X5_9BACT|nr:hypothetical protein [Neolewinella antarctica]NJC26017.1 hypothetical protein [Neolewinella antarctica]